jgi:hypothetical protein
MAMVVTPQSLWIWRSLFLTAHWDYRLVSQINTSLFYIFLSSVTHTKIVLDKHV